MARESAKKSLALFWLDFVGFLFTVCSNLLGASSNLSKFGKFGLNLRKPSAPQNLLSNFKFSSNLACKRVKFIVPNLPKMQATGKGAQAKFAFSFKRSTAVDDEGVARDPASF